MKPFRKTSFSVHPPDGTRCRRAYPGGNHALNRLLAAAIDGMLETPRPAEAMR